MSTHLRIGLPSGLFPSGFPTICANSANKKWQLLVDDCTVVEGVVSDYKIPSACPSKARDA
jgi:hypothetical protein